MTLDQFLRWYAGPILNVLGPLAILYLAWRGITWLEARMSQDVSAYQLLDRFHIMHNRSTTPLQDTRGRANGRTLALGFAALIVLALLAKYHPDMAWMAYLGATAVGVALGLLIARRRSA